MMAERLRGTMLRARAAQTAWTCSKHPPRRVQAQAQAAGTCTVTEQTVSQDAPRPVALSLQIEVVRSISDVPAEDWDAVATTALRTAHHDSDASGPASACPSDEYEINPFVLHSFLHALETSGSVGRSRGWVPCHLVVREAPPSGQAAKTDEDGSAAADDGSSEAAMTESASAQNPAEQQAADQPTGGRQGALLGCCPLYIKGHSQGEYVFDQSWAQFSYRLGQPYYPKLQCAVPFTPCPGPRLMVRGDLGPETRKAVMQAMGKGLIQVAESSGMSSVHVTFCTAEEWAALAELGFLQRMGIQFHLDNRGYSDFEAFLSSLKQSKRAAIRKERKSIAKQGLQMQVLTGNEIQAHHWDRFYEFYLNTIDRYDSFAYLTKEFFHTLGKVMPERVMLVVANERQAGQGGGDSKSASSGKAGAVNCSSAESTEGGAGVSNATGALPTGCSSSSYSSSVDGSLASVDAGDPSAQAAGTSASGDTADVKPKDGSSGSSGDDGSTAAAAAAGSGSGGPEIVAAAFNLMGSHALFGRNWGCSKEYRNLHFEASYYTAIEQAIQRGLQRVEAGAQGLHKLQRGYMPSITYSAHYLLDPTLKSVVARSLESERAAQLQQLQVLTLEGSPYKDEATLELLTKRVQAHFTATYSSYSSGEEEPQEQ